MKRFITLMIVFFILYLGLQFIFKFTTNGFENEYEIISDKTYLIKETYTANKKGERNNYFITIRDDNHKFAYQIYEGLGKNERVVKDVRTYSDNQYSCILPIFRNGEKLVDVTCISNGIQYYYHDIQGRDSALDNFVSNLPEEEYELSQFEDHASSANQTTNVIYYPDNMIKDHYYSFQTYRGSYLLNNRNAKKTYFSELFDKDVYNMTISAYAGKYYVVADYNSEYEFNKFYLIDMKNLKKEMIEYHKTLSFDSYVQGVVDNSVYIFDRNSKTQYELNVKTKSLVEVGNVDLKIKYYKNGVWSTVSAYDAMNSRLYFIMQETNSSDEYERVDKVGNELSGFYYYYKKVGQNYEVYRSNVQEPSIMTYLFNTNSISQIQYLDDYIYYINGDTVYYYHDTVGIRKLYKNTEIKFNSTLSFGVVH